MVETVTTTGFKSLVIDAETPVLVDFYADWCGPCQVQAPVLDRLATTLGDTARVAKVDIDQSPELADLFGIRSIPTLILFSRGKIAHRFTGLTSERDLVNMVAGHLRS